MCAKVVINHDQFVTNLLKTGGIKAAVRESGISQVSLYRERKRDPEFDRRVASALEYARELRLMQAHDNYQYLRANIIDILNAAPMTPDQLARKTNTTLEQAAVTLLDNRAAGLIVFSGGKYRVKRG